MAVLAEWALVAPVLRRLALVFSLRADVARASGARGRVVFAGGAARRARDARRFTGLPVVLAGRALRALVPLVI